MRKNLFLAALAAGLLLPPGTATAQVTYAEHVARVLRNNCMTCHRPGGIAPFSLVSYRDAATRADRIVRAVSSGFMPPWLPDSGYQRFIGERRLADEEIAIIQDWVVGGLAVGDTTTLDSPAFQTSEWQLGTPDLVVSVPRFELSPHDSDVYRNLVVSIPVERDQYVKAVELKPGGTNVVHHARMMVDTTSSSRELADQDPGPGFNGMDLLSNAQNPDGFFVGWTPGKVPHESPDGMAWPLAAGTDLVLQLHLPASDRTQVVEPSIGLYFADREPERHPALLMLGSFDIDIPAGQAEYIVTDRFEVPVDVYALGLYPHAHYLGKKIEAYARTPDGRVTWLLRISNWDFNWQDEYHFAEPVPLPAGTVITMQITYDNSAGNPNNPNDPPRRVVYGSNSTDEMGDLVVQLLPQRQSDYETLRGTLDLFHYSAVVTKIAQDEWQLGRQAAAAGDMETAIAHFRESIANRFNDPRVHNDIGSALARLGQNEAATAHFRQALQFAPGWPSAMANLARHLALTSPDEASRQEGLAIAQRAADITNGQDPAVMDAVAVAFASNGRLDLAIEAAEAALALAEAQSRSELADAIRRRLERYRQGR